MRVEVQRRVGLEHAVLVEQRQARRGHAHHRVGLRVGLLGQQLGGDDAGGVAHPLDLDVGVDLVEAFLVGLELVGLERGVDQQLGLLRRSAPAASASRPAPASRAEIEAMRMVKSPRGGWVRVAENRALCATRDLVTAR